MAQIESGGKGGRSTSIELNLVPFIDLMSVLITFLLITAVWTQVSMIQIGSSLYGKKTEDVTPVPPENDVVLRLDIKPNGYLLVVDKQSTMVPLVNDEYDEAALISLLEKAKQQYPTKSDAAIQMSDELPYERLIHGMDNLLKAGFPAISVLTGGPN